MEKIKSSRFRSPKTSAILRDYLRNPSDFHLARWTESAIEDFAEWANFTPANDRQRNTLAVARRSIREGAEIFALSFWPNCATFDGRMSNRDDARAFRGFIDRRVEDIQEMARLAE